MKRTTGYVAAALIILVAAGMTFASAKQTASLDGKSFKVQLIPDGEKSGTPDTLSFSGGMFDSSACHAYGFGRSEYTVRDVGNTVSFEVHALSKDNGKEIWNGTVEGDRIHGTVKMTDPKGMVKRYHFEGETATM